MSPQHAPPARTTGALGYTTRNFLIVAVLALVGALAAGLIGPNPRLGPAAAGDEALVAEVAAIVGEGRGLTQLAVARLDGDRTDFAGFGDPLPSPDTPFELGSITKVFVGHVLADAVARGDVALDDPLETYLPELAGTPAGGVTLVSLATHTSGLPRLPEGVGGLRSALSPSDPYPAWGVGQLTDAARAAALERPGTEAYSNLGMALLGHALARAAEAPSWAALAEERLFAPLGMTATVTVARPADELPGLAQPHWVNGRAAEPWTGEAFAPAGSSTRTTARDLATFARAVLDGTAPGMDAARLVTGEPTSGNGLGWAFGTADGPLLWHNGGTGGTRTMLTIDRESGRAALALATTDDGVESIATHLVLDTREPAWRAEIGRFGLVALVVGGALLLSCLLGLRRPPTKVAAASTVIDAGLGMVLLALLGPWHWLPGGVIGALLGAFVGAPALTLGRAARAPWLPASHASGAIATLAVSVLLAAAAVFLLV